MESLDVQTTRWTKVLLCVSGVPGPAVGALQPGRRRLQPHAAPPSRGQRGLARGGAGSLRQRVHPAPGRGRREERGHRVARAQSGAHHRPISSHDWERPPLRTQPQLPRYNWWMIDDIHYGYDCITLVHCRMSLLFTKFQRTGPVVFSMTQLCIWISLNNERNNYLEWLWIGTVFMIWQVYTQVSLFITDRCNYMNYSMIINLVCVCACVSVFLY